MNKPGVTAYIGIGGNLRDPVAMVKRGIAELARIAESRLANCSSLYRTAPLGPPGQADYINAVAELETSLPALALLDALQAIEQACGRRRDGQRWGPRTLDLDLLLYAEQRIEQTRLRTPHPEMHKRAFVLIPLSELVSGDFIIPGVGALQDALRHCDQGGVQRLED